MSDDFSDHNEGQANGLPEEVRDGEYTSEQEEFIDEEESEEFIEEEELEEQYNDEQEEQNIPVGNILGQDGNGPREPLLNTPLCQCTTTTEGDALLMCLALGMRHNLSWVALVDVLKLVNKLFGHKVIAESKYFLFKYFDKMKDPDSAQIHLYCPQCNNYMGVQNLMDPQKEQRCQCGKQVKMRGQKASYFVSTNVTNQLKDLLEKPEIAEEIMTYRFQRRRINEESIEDVYDGECYQKFSGEGGLLSDGKNFSVTFNTDGMDLGTSSARSAWPIFMYINELSPRNRKKHIIFAGVWVGKNEPNMNLFLTPFVDEMKTLAEDGFQWINGNNEEVTSRVLTLIGVFDSGARYKLLNLSSHAGYYACTFCYQKTVYYPKRGCKFVIVDQPAPLRTHDSMMDNMLQFHNSTERNFKKKIHWAKGCVGFTKLVELHPYFDLGRGVIVDFMHNALLGCTRTLVLHFRESFGLEYYIGDPDITNIINSRLEMIRPPSSITRTPREITQAKKWKASEWRMFLIFYGLLCFDTLLPQKHLIHFALLSKAFYLLLQKSIPVTDFEIANQYLRRFVYLNQDYYGEFSMNYNVHLLLHVVAGVKDWGPLWGPNTFIFEGENRHLRDMNTSSGHVGIQLTRRYLILAEFPKYVQQYSSTDRPLDFIQDIMGKHYKYFNRCDQSILAGNGAPLVLLHEEMECLRNAGILCGADVLSFEKCLYDGIEYATSEFCAGKKYDDSWVKTDTGRRGSIEKILKIHHEGRDVAVLILKELIVHREPVLRDPLVTVTHIMTVDRRGCLFAVMPSNIVNQCIFFNMDEANFISDIPYGCYGD